YAAAALRELENVAKQAGADRISLHVFAHNEGAISLYRKLGYEPTNLVLSKRLMTPASGASAEITAKESGRNRRTTSSPPPKTFISDLRPGRVATIEATVTKLEPVREVEQRLGGKKKVRNGVLKDGTGEIALVLWGDEVGLVSEGEALRVVDGWVKEYKDVRRSR
ncbi:protein containing GCN5-related N-acetyltransferase, partial [mine drainage metagenome]